MKTYKIPVVWQMMGTVEVQAESLDDAVEKVLDTSVPLPEDGEYIEGSFEVDESVYSTEDDDLWGEDKISFVIYYFFLP